jgi:mannose-6-phosphate isomerase-like protein (cupin superfamily)
MSGIPRLPTSRRKCLATLASLVPMASVRGVAASAKSASSQAVAAQTVPAAAKPRLVSKAYPFAELKERKSGGNSSWAILNGQTWAGCPIEVHETRLAPGASPHPPHHHAHEEMFLIREGTLEVTIAGQTARIGPGSAAYVASNDQHGVKNVGETAALYFVLAVGNQ